MMTKSVIPLLLMASAAWGETRFEDAARILMGGSNQGQMVVQDRIRTGLEYQTAIGNLYDPTLKASFWDQYKGDYLNRRLDVSIQQRTGLWGLSVLGGYRLGQGSFATYDGKLETQDKGEVRFGFELPLLRNGWTDSFRTAVKKGDLSRSLALDQERVQKLDLMRQLGARYWDWFVNAHRLRISKGLLELAAVRQEKIRVRVGRGDIAKIEELEGERTILQRRAQVAQAERNHIKTKLDLEVFVSTQSSTNPLSLELADLPAPDSTLPSESDERMDLDQHPEIKRQGTLLRQAELDADLASNQFLPKLDLALNLSQDYGTAVYGLSKARSEAGVLFEFPIPSRAATARTSQMRAMVLKQDAQALLARSRVENAVTDAKNALRLARERAGISSQELALSKTLVEMENKRFLNGDSNLLLLNLREQNFAEAEIRQIEAFSDLRRSQNELNVALGRLEFE